MVRDVLEQNCPSPPHPQLKGLFAIPLSRLTRVSYRRQGRTNGVIGVLPGRHDTTPPRKVAMDTHRRMNAHHVSRKIRDTADMQRDPAWSGKITVHHGLDSWSRKPTRNLSKAPEEASAEEYCDPPRLPRGGGGTSIVICIISQVLVGWCFGQFWTVPQWSMYCILSDPYERVRFSRVRVEPKTQDPDLLLSPSLSLSALWGIFILQISIHPPGTEGILRPCAS